MNHSFLFRQILIIALLSAGARVRAEEPIKNLRVLSIGHSFHAMFVPQLMAQVAESAGIEGHQVAGVSLLGGSKVIQHWTTSDEKHQAKELLTAGNIDVVTMSPMQKPDEGIEKFSRLALEHNPNIRIFVQEFWLPRDKLIGFTEEEQKIARNWVDKPSNVPNTAAFTGNFDVPTAEQLRQLHTPYFKTMDDHITQLNKTLGKPVVFVIPAGQAVIALREKVLQGKVPGITKQSDLFHDFIGHGTKVLEMLVTYCNFATIYRRSPVGLPIQQVMKRNYNSAELNRLLQELAWEAVTNHPLSGVKNTNRDGHPD